MNMFITTKHDMKRQRAAEARAAEKRRVEAAQAAAEELLHATLHRLACQKRAKEALHDPQTKREVAIYEAEIHNMDIIEHLRRMK